jgi:CTD small phosphatase-like protein 2
VNEFLEEISSFYEIVVFTASLPNYANMILDMIDKDNFITHRLYR